MPHVFYTQGVVLRSAQESRLFYASNDAFWHQQCPYSTVSFSLLGLLRDQNNGACPDRRGALPLKNQSLDAMQHSRVRWRLGTHSCGSPQYDARISMCVGLGIVTGTARLGSRRGSVMMLVVELLVCTSAPRLGERFHRRRAAGTAQTTWEHRKCPVGMEARTATQSSLTCPWAATPGDAAQLQCRQRLLEAQPVACLTFTSCLEGGMAPPESQPLSRFDDIVFVVRHTPASILHMSALSQSAVSTLRRPQ